MMNSVSSAGAQLVVDGGHLELVLEVGDGAQALHHHRGAQLLVRRSPAARRRAPPARWEGAPWPGAPAPSALPSVNSGRLLRRGRHRHHHLVHQLGGARDHVQVPAGHGVERSGGQGSLHRGASASLPRAQGTAAAPRTTATLLRARGSRLPPRTTASTDPPQYPRTCGATQGTIRMRRAAASAAPFAGRGVLVGHDGPRAQARPPPASAATKPKARARRAARTAGPAAPGRREGRAHAGGLSQHVGPVQARPRAARPSVGTPSASTLAAERAQGRRRPSRRSARTAAPRDSASSPSAPDPGERVQHHRPLEASRARSRARS